jgi:hypothetical protein
MDMTMKNLTICKNHYKNAYANDKGVILPIVVLLLIVLSLLILVGAKWASLDITRTKNYTKTRQAFYVAETGIEVAMNYLNYDNTGVAGSGAGADGFEDELADAPTFGTNWPAATFQNIAYNDGIFTVTMTNNNDNGACGNLDCDDTVILTSTATKRGRTSTIEAIVYRGKGESNHAFIANKDVVLNGNATVNGGAHTNADAELNGGPTISPSITASGACTPADPQCDDNNVPTQFIPNLDMEDFKDLADVVLLNGSPTRFEWRNVPVWDINAGPAAMVTGTYQFEKIQTTVVDNVGGIPTNVNYTCWKPVGDNSPTRCDGSDPNDADGVAPIVGTDAETQQNFYKLLEDNFGDVSQTGNNEWKVNGTKLPQDVYIYVEHKTYPTVGGKITIQNTPSPWSVSIISTGAINFNGNAVLENYSLNPGNNDATDNIFLFAGSDVNGGANAEFTSLTPDGMGGFLPTQGIIYAHDQIDFAGDANLEGAILIYDGNDTPSSDFHGYIGWGQSRLTGTVTINHVGNMDVPWPGPVRILSWREIEVVS